jgi:hypothetical protein
MTIYTYRYREKEKDREDRVVKRVNLVSINNDELMYLHGEDWFLGSDTV